MQTLTLKKAIHGDQLPRKLVHDLAYDIRMIRKGGSTTSGNIQEVVAVIRPWLSKPRLIKGHGESVIV
jgi:hypothetical protein